MGEWPILGPILKFLGWGVCKVVALTPETVGKVAEATQGVIKTVLTLLGVDCTPPV